MRIIKHVHVYWLLAVLLLVMLGPDRAFADGICSSPYAGPILSSGVDGQYSYVACNVGSTALPRVGGSGAFTVSVDGPKGVELFVTPKTPDAMRAFYFNDQGEFVWSYEETGDRATNYGVYTSPANGIRRLISTPGSSILGRPQSFTTTRIALAVSTSPFIPTALIPISP